MYEVHQLLGACRLKYKRKESPLREIGGLIAHCLGKLRSDATTRQQSAASAGQRRRRPVQVETEGGELAEVIVPTKTYSVFVSGNAISRPFLPSTFIGNPRTFSAKWKALILALDERSSRIEMEAKAANAVLYTAVNAFSICYDLWKPGSRKTPGTFLELLMGSLLERLLPNRIRTVFIPIPGESQKVATDISFVDAGGGSGLVFPAKITTRERIVQPFAHQRILDSVFGLASYRTILLCGSELQRDGDIGINEICVPGPIKLYQKYLAQIGGIYYLDPPERYLQTDVKEVIPVGTIGEFLTSGLAELLNG